MPDDSHWLPDASSADWVVLDPARPLMTTVSTMVPPTFASFARVLHPLWLQGVEYSWQQLADLSDQPLHARARAEELLAAVAGRPEGNWVYSGQVSPPPERMWRLLTDVLLQHTTSPSLILGYSDIFGIPHPPLAGHIDLYGGNRGFFLAQMATDELGEPAVRNHGFLPQLTWPTDAEWFVHSEIEFFTTYVGGSVEAIEGVLRCPGLEAFPVQPGDPV